MSHLSVICSGAVLYNSVFSHGAQESNHAVSGQSAGQDGPEQHPEKNRGTFLQLLQTLSLGLFERSLSHAQKKRGPLFISSP